MSVETTMTILPLRISGLGFDVEGKTLLQGIDCTVAKGGVTAVLGPNGAGKSLFLRLCHGLLQPTSGSVLWATQGGLLTDAEQRPVKRHGMVFQRPVMLRRSARDNLAHALKATGAARKESRIEAALSRFGLTHLAHNPARLLSGGEQQRLAIAKAWAIEPEVLFLDEPTSQLDPGATGQIETMIHGLAAEGMTIVMATHDLGQARRLASRVLFLNHGRLIEDTDSATFFALPRTNEARAFLAGELLWKDSLS